MRTWPGFVYAFVIDVYSRFIVGWASQPTCAPIFRSSLCRVVGRGVLCGRHRGDQETLRRNSGEYLVLPSPCSLLRQHENPMTKLRESGEDHAPHQTRRGSSLRRPRSVGSSVGHLDPQRRPRRGGATIDSRMQRCSLRSRAFAHPPSRIYYDRKRAQGKGHIVSHRASVEPTALEALEMAIWRRDHGALDGLIHHADAGSKYTSIRYTEGSAKRASNPRSARSATATITPWPSPRSGSTRPS